MGLELENLTIAVQGRPLFVDLEWQASAGASVAIMGPSGSGKTSLLNAIAGLMPSTGRVIVGRVVVSELKRGAREQHRLENIGMVFQDGDLLPELTAVENAELPGRLLGWQRSRYRAQAVEHLEIVGLGDRLGAWPSELSGGELQRVAIARALNTGPTLLLADEPTGALDRGNADGVSKLLTELAHDLQTCVVIATHDPAVAQYCDSVYRYLTCSLVRE